MTREEALQRLEGTWTFDLTGDRVLVRDPALLSAVQAVRRERAEQAAREAAPKGAMPGRGVEASGD